MKRDELARLRCRQRCEEHYAPAELPCFHGQCESWEGHLDDVDEFLDALMEPGEVALDAGARNIWNENQACHGGDPEWDNLTERHSTYRRIYRGYALDGWQAILTAIREGK